MTDDFVNDDFSKAFRELLVMTSEEEGDSWCEIVYIQPFIDCLSDIVNCV